MRLIVNNDLCETDLPPGEATLDFLRTGRGLKGTKEGCREGDCGACTVLVGELRGGRVRYRPACSCILPLGLVEDRHVVTIEVLTGAAPSPVQRAIVDHGATQCGFCTPGIVVSATALLLEAERLDDDATEVALAGNLCRCTGYESIRRAARAVLAAFPDLPAPGPERVGRLIAGGALPGWFAGIPERLAALGGAGDGPEAGGGVPVGGGTDLWVQRGSRLRDTPLRFVRARPAAPVEARGDLLIVDAAATVADLEGAGAFREAVPGFDRAARLIASPQIRARGTVGGNIVNASPIGDLSVIFLALGAEVTISGPGGTRTLPLRELFRGYKQLDLADGEIIESLTVHRAPAGRFHFEKVSRRTHLDIASVNTAAWFETDGETVTRARLSAGGVAPIPLFLARASAAVAERPASWETAALAAGTADREIAPIGDVRGSAEYKRLLLRQLLLAHFVTAFGLEGDRR
jgi:xanthine dehydrogenase small subunit